MQTAPLGQVSPAQLYVHSPPGIAVAQLAPTEQLASLVQGSPMVRVESALQMPVSQTWPPPQSASFAHPDGLSLLQAAKTAAKEIAASAAGVRNRTVPPSSRREAVP